MTKMAEPATLTIRRDFPRPDRALIDAFAGVPSGYVVDALGRTGALHWTIRAITKTASFVGPALTVRSRGRDNLAPWAAIEFAKPGDILVVATGANEEASVIGDLLAGMARNRGIAGIVTDGLVRDVPGLNEVGLPVFARGVTPNSPFKTGPGAIGTPIDVMGAHIGPGDLIVADSDGVVVVPAGGLAAAAAELANIRAKEAAMDARVRAGDTAPAWLPGFMKTADIRYLD
jgi:4-hydroxy-4-methyl-2-oxoglutarate aldolase